MFQIIHYQHRLILNQKIVSVLHIEDDALGINLEHNNLSSLESAQFPTNLIQLHLSDNKLRRLPESILENQTNLKHVTLSGNPWKCDCKEWKWLASKNSIVRYFYDTFVQLLVFVIVQDCMQAERDHAKKVSETVHNIFQW